MKYRRVIVLLAFVMIVSVLGVGCGRLNEIEETEALVWRIRTGDELFLDVNNEAGYSLTEKAPFEIKKGEEVLSVGDFLDIPTYEKYLSSVKGDPISKIEEENSRDGMTYTLFNRADKEFNYLILIEGGKTAIILENKISLDSAREAFSTFKVTLKPETAEGGAS